MIPGEIIAASGDIELNAGAPTVTLEVSNTGDRPVQVGSHYHFAETNAGLSFDRDKARGLSAGANAYLLKSAFDQRELLAAIREMV